MAMKRATSTTAACASQVQQPVATLQGKIHDLLLNPLTARTEEEATLFKGIGCVKTSVLASSSSTTVTSKDEAKAKSSAMPRLLAVDSDNYMLRKGVGTVNGVSSSNATTMTAAPTTTTSITSASNEAVGCSRVARAFLTNAPTNATYTDLQMHSILGYNNTETRQQQQLQLQQQQSYEPRIKPTVVTSASTNQFSAQRWLASHLQAQPRCLLNNSNNGNNKSDSPQQQQFLSASNEEKRENETELDNRSRLLCCARVFSFHRYVCRCHDAVVTLQQQHQLSKESWEIESAVVDLNWIENDAIVGSNSSVDKATRSSKGKSACDTLEARTFAASRVPEGGRLSACCCMCASLCPADCRACFHIVCSVYSGQHLCQWSNKGHALPGQIFYEDKVSISVFYLTYSCPF